MTRKLLIFAWLFVLCFALGCTRDITEKSSYHMGDKDSEQDNEMDYAEIDETEAIDVDEHELEAKEKYPEIACRDTLDYGCLYGGLSSSEMLYIENTGSAYLKILKLEMSETAEKNFYIPRLSDNSFPITLPSGEHLEVQVDLHYTCPGSNSGELYIHSNDPETPKFTVQLRTGCKCCQFPLPKITPEKIFHDFGQVKLGQTSEVLTVRFANPIDAAYSDACYLCCNMIYIDKITFVGDEGFKHDDAFDYDKDDPIILSAGSAMVFDLSLKGKSIGRKYSQLKIYHSGESSYYNEETTTPYILDLEGTVVK